MMQFIKTSIIAIALALTSISATAAPQQTDRQSPADREQRVQMRAKRIATEIALDDAATSKFIDTYCDYHKEMRQLRADSISGRKARAERHKDHKKEALSSKSEEEIRQTITRNLDQSSKMLDIRKKYYAEYSKFLTQKQIARIYELDNRTPDHFRQHRNRK